MVGKQFIECKKYFQLYFTILCYSLIVLLIATRNSGTVLCLNWGTLICNIIIQYIYFWQIHTNPVLFSRQTYYEFKLRYGFFGMNVNISMTINNLCYKGYFSLCNVENWWTFKMIKLEKLKKASCQKISNIAYTTIRQRYFISLYFNKLLTWFMWSSYLVSFNILLSFIKCGTIIENILIRWKN